MNRKKFRAKGRGGQLLRQPDSQQMRPVIRFARLKSTDDIRALFFPRRSAARARVCARRRILSIGYTPREPRKPIERKREREGAEARGYRVIYRVESALSPNRSPRLVWIERNLESLVIYDRRRRRIISFRCMPVLCGTTSLSAVTVQLLPLLLLLPLLILFCRCCRG